MTAEKIIDSLKFTFEEADEQKDLFTPSHVLYKCRIINPANNRDYFNFGVKTMEESMGPCEDHCPASILSLLSPTDSEYANNWRERCRKNIEAKKDPHALKNLPVGAVIRFTLHTGESIELLKHAAAYQFKRPFWFCQSSGRYMPATRIPANYEVVVTA